MSKLRFLILIAALLAGSVSISTANLVEHREDIQVILNRLDALEKKVEILEKRNEIQENKINHLEAELQIYRTGAGKVETETKIVVNQLFRTCEELRAANPSLPSDYYYIDPDGIGRGDDAIIAYCDLLTGATMVGHDNEGITSIPHCPDPGCFESKVNYKATMKQMMALTELSASCFQSITYHCNYAPLEVAGEQYSWWTDRNGDPHYYWDGENNDNHTCHCGLTNSCLDPAYPCNCDAGVPTNLEDAGLLTDKNALPVTSLHFGHTSSPFTNASYTLGRFECRGKPVVSERPESCADLWKQGQTFSGYYNLKVGENVKMVYCDMDKLPDGAGMQDEIGNVDVKSKQVAFFVGRHAPFSGSNTIITYEDIHLNEGNAVDISSGVFTVPVHGIYFIVFTAEMDVIVDSLTFAALVVNSTIIKAVASLNRFENSGLSGSCSFSIALEFNAGDQVAVYLNPYFNKTGKIFDNSNPHTLFMGFLIQEIFD